MTKINTPAPRALRLAVAVLLALAACGDDDEKIPTDGAVPVTLGQPGPGDAGAHFPMQVGNVWQFAGASYFGPGGGGGPQRTWMNVVRTIGTRDVGGPIATVFRESSPSGEATPDEDLLVGDANGVAYFGTGVVDAFSRQLLPYWQLRFPLEVGSRTVQLSKEGVGIGDDLDGDLVDETADLRAVVTVRGIEEVTVPAGTFASCVRVEWGVLNEVRLSKDGSHTTTNIVATAWLAPGVGWVKRETTVTVDDSGYSQTEREELVAYAVNGRSASISLRATPETASLFPYASTRLQVQAFAADGTPMPATPWAPGGVQVTWSSSHPDVATVGYDGWVYATAAGITDVTARAGEVASNAVAVTVSGTGGGGGGGGGTLARIVVTPSAVGIAQNGTAQLQASAYDGQGYPIYSSPQLSWTSDDPAIATVDASGRVRGLAPGTAHVTASSGGVTSDPITVTVSDVAVLGLATNDLVHDASRQRIYASVPSRQGVTGNSIAVIDPATRSVEATVFVGSEPRKLALSDDARFLYVALDGAGKVARVDLAAAGGPAVDLTFSLGQVDFYGQRFVEDMEVMPGAPSTVAISLKYEGLSPRHAGVAVYDDGVQRPTMTPGHTGANVIEFSADGTILYGYNNETTEFGFRRMQIDAQGVTVLTVDELFTGFYSDMAFDRGLVFSNAGQVVDAEARTLAGSFTGVGYGALVCPDPASARVLFLVQSGQYGSGPWALAAYDRDRFVPLGSEVVPSVSGTPGSLVRWGSAGIAFRTSDDAVFFLTSSLAGP